MATLVLVEVPPAIKYKNDKYSNKYHHMIPMNKNLDIMTTKKKTKSKSFLLKKEIRKTVNVARVKIRNIKAELEEREFLLKQRFKTKEKNKIKKKHSKNYSHKHNNKIMDDAKNNNNNITKVKENISRYSHSFKTSKYSRSSNSCSFISQTLVRCQFIVIFLPLVLDVIYRT